MNEFLDKLSYWLQQAYVYLPIILSFISAIGLPSLVQIAKIFASAKLYLTRTKVLMNKVNECVDTINKMSNMINSFIDNELVFTEQLESSSYNKKQKALCIEHKQHLIELKTKSMNFKVEVIPQEELQKKKKVKVKVVKEK